MVDDILITGRVDRVDQRKRSVFLIIDYKLSSLATLRLELGQKNILSRHFQMPIYWRLVAQYLAKGDASKEVKFSFASIRDGQMLSVASKDLSIIDRIFDDQGANGLGQAIDGIFAPIKEGKVVCITR